VDETAEKNICVSELLKAGRRTKRLSFFTGVRGVGLCNGYVTRR